MDTNALLAALFDLVREKGTFHDVSMLPADQQPAFDLYVVRGQRAIAPAIALLERAGLAHPVDWHGLTLYRLDDAAREALG